MFEHTEQDTLLTEFLQERSIRLRECSMRRTVKMLEAQRKRFREDLEQLIRHIALLVPLAGGSSAATDSYSDLLQDAVKQLGDDAFAQFLLQVLQEVK